MSELKLRPPKKLSNEVVAVYISFGGRGPISSGTQ